MTQKDTDKIFDIITSNSCREMTKIRFHQAVNEVLEEKQEKINDLNNELSFARRIILAASDKTENRELYDYSDMLRKEKLV